MGWYGSSPGEGDHDSRAGRSSEPRNESDSGRPIVGEPTQLDSKRGKDVMQQVTGHPQFHYAKARTRQQHAADSRPGYAPWG
jgi:hypothetical protein